MVVTATGVGERPLFVSYVSEVHLEEHVPVGARQQGQAIAAGLGRHRSHHR